MTMKSRSLKRIIYHLMAFASVSLLVTGPASADNIDRFKRAKIKRSLLEQVLNKKLSKAEEKPKKKISGKSFFSKDLLKSRFGSWAIDPNNTSSSINLERAWEKFEKKQDVVVAVIDTGIDPNHPYLRNNLHRPDESSSQRSFGIDFSKGRKSKYLPHDSHGHGTHVSGIVKQVFPGRENHDAKVLQSSGFRTGQFKLDD